MSARILPFLGLALAFLGLGVMGLPAEEPAPRPDTASTNSSQISRKSSPLSELEAGLKKPFEIFKADPSAGKFRDSPLNYVPPAPVINNKKLRELMEKRAEESYLSPEDDDAAPWGEDWLKSDQGSAPGSSGRKDKSPLDRLYDRNGATQSTPTNKTPSLDFFGNRIEKDERGFKGSPSLNSLFGNALSASGQSFKPATNISPEGGRLSSDSLKPRSFRELFGLGPAPVDTAEARMSETRLDAFKELLDGPTYTPRNDYGVTTLPSARSSLPLPRPALGAAAPASASAWSSSLQPPVGTAFEDTPGFAGAPGKPAGVPDYAAGTPSLTPTAPLQQPKLPPPATFNIPRRRF
jgi:hypothetical protein